MRKALKILGWTLLGIVLTIVAVVCIAIYIVFTPERLTPIARQAADTYITCQHEIGEVDLTFFSTFPRFGLRANGLLLINPKEGAQNDTVVAARSLTATVDVMEFINHSNLHIHEAVLDEAQVNFYIAPDGTTNLTDVFVTSPDTTQEEDTTAFSLPFDELHIDGLRLQANAITFVDDKDTISASIGTTELTAAANSWEDLFIGLDAQNVCASLKNETYADSLHLRLNAPLAADLNTMHFAFRRAELAINEFAIMLGGTVDLQDSIALDLGIATQEAWGIKPLLALVPATFTKSLKDIDVDGMVQLEANIEGVYSDSSMPLIDAHLILEDGQGRYKPIPYTLRDMCLDAEAKLNLNEGQTSDVTIRCLSAKTKNSQVGAEGTIQDLLGDMLLDLKLNVDANLPDFAYFFPDSMSLEGRIQGTADTKLHLSDLDKSSIPFAQADLKTDHLVFTMDTTIAADLGATTIHAEGKKILSNQAEYSLSLQTATLTGSYEDINANLTDATLQASVRSGKTLKAQLRTQTLNARMGDELNAQTGTLALEAASRYNPEGENILLQWNPRLKIDLKDGILTMPERLPEPVYIPSIEFKYSNREMTIDNSRIELGHSDINLKGNVRHIGKWLRHKEILEGELELISNHCDANQLMAWFSDDSGSEETATNEQSAITNDSVQTESEPFLVPTDVNLSLHTHMQEVEIFNQVAKDLKGGIYLNEGTLILDEVGFVCRAAKLQLTAMYRTPRRNHLYVGLDYHMLDVDIDELLTMIPGLEEMVPMLSSFQGAAEFHLAAETYLKSNYEPKMSTLRGAASLTGKDLVVLDGETFDKISRLLLFSKKTENRIDSLNAELTIYKNQIDLYPLCVQMDNYMVALGGRHNTNMTFDYDINVLSPIYLGVNVSGTMDDLDIKLAPCKFAQDFKPRWFDKTDTQSRELRERIKQSMERNVRIK